jgi:hypothetical protein
MHRCINTDLIIHVNTWVDSLNQTASNTLIRVYLLSLQHPLCHQYFSYMRLSLIEFASTTVVTNKLLNTKKLFGWLPSLPISCSIWYQEALRSKEGYACELVDGSSLAKRNPWGKLMDTWSFFVGLGSKHLLVSRGVEHVEVGWGIVSVDTGIWRRWPILFLLKMAILEGEQVLDIQLVFSWLGCSFLW